MKLTNVAMASITALFLMGCGGGSSSSSSVDLPSEKIIVFFDNNSSKQYFYDTEKKAYEDMNADSTKAYDMTNKNGQLYTWNHEVSEGKHEQKIAMISDQISLGDTNLTQANYVYLAHLHEEANGTHELEADSSSDVNSSTLTALNQSLNTYKTVKQEITSALQTVASTETLCNFIVLGEEHEEHGSSTEHNETQPHIALTQSGKIYVFKENNTTNTLEKSQTEFSLDGISNCTADKSSIVQVEEYGMMVFSAESQTVYIVDSHEGADFHEHSKTKVNLFLPSGFTPTQIGITGESNETAHNH